MTRNRRLGERITATDAIVIGEHTFAAADCPTLIGEVIRSLRWTVLTTDPEPTVIVMPTLPAVKAAPNCFNCGEPSTHVWEQDYEPKQYLCKECFDEAEHNDERNERALHAD